MKKLGEICYISSGGTPSRNKPEYYKGDIPWAKISDIEKAKSGIITETEESISKEGLESIGNRIFPAGTLLFAMYGSIGKVAITGKELTTNQAILGIRPKDANQVYLPFLKVWFERNKQMLINQGRGVALQNLSATIIRNLKIPIPPFPEQIFIANVLAKAENLIAERKESIRLLDEYLKCVFLDMFGDPIKNDKKWQIKRLDEIGCLERGRFSPRPRSDPSYFNGIYPFIQTGDISRSANRIKTYTQSLNEKGTLVSKKFNKGIIVIAIVGATIGATAVCEIDVYATDSIIGIDVNKQLADNYFLEFLLRFWKPVLLRIAPEAARANINLGILDKLKVPIPPIALQEKFTSALNKIESIKEEYKRSLQELENLYGSLSQMAFNGTLDNNLHKRK
jgi:type I restriction enzyme S subunit